MLLGWLDVRPRRREPMKGPAATEQPREPLPVVAQRRRRSEHQEISRAAEPHVDVRKDLSQAADDSRDDRQWELIELYPLTEHAVIRQPALGDAEKLRRIEGRD